MNKNVWIINSDKIDFKTKESEVIVMDSSYLIKILEYYSSKHLHAKHKANKFIKNSIRYKIIC